MIVTRTARRTSSVAIGAGTHGGDGDSSTSSSASSGTRTDGAMEVMVASLPASFLATAKNRSLIYLGLQVSPHVSSLLGHARYPCALRSGARDDSAMREAAAFNTAAFNTAAFNTACCHLDYVSW